MRDDPPFTHQVLIGLITLVLMAGAVTVGLKFSVGAFADVYTLHATFARAGHGMDDSSTVKVRGVTVGRVASVKLLPDGRADVTLRMQRASRVPDTAVASAEPLSVFGPEYVKLEPGAHEASGPYLRAGGRITHTTPPTEITDILTKVSPLLRSIDPQELLTVLDTLARSLDGLGPQIGRTLDNTSVVAGLLDHQSADVRQFLTDLGHLSSTLGSKAGALAQSAQDLNAVLPVVSSHTDQLGQLLNDASRLSGDLADLVNGHSTALDQTIAGLLTAVGPVYQQLASLPGFLQSLNGFFDVLAHALLRYSPPAAHGHIVGLLEGTEPANLCQILGLPC